MTNTTFERVKARDFFTCRYFSFYEQLKFRAQLSMKKVLKPQGLISYLIIGEHSEDKDISIWSKT